MTAAGVLYTVVMVSLITADWSFHLLIRPAWLGQWNFWYGPVYSVLNVVMASYELGHGNPEACSLYASIALIVFLLWWHNPKNRDRRKKWAKKLKGKVVDLGGRLGVRHPAPTRA